MKHALFILFIFCLPLHGLLGQKVISASSKPGQLEINTGGKPPVVQFLKNNDATSSQMYEVIATINSNSPIKKTELYVNGNLKTKQEKLEFRGTAYKNSVELNYGANIIEIKATNSFGTSEAELNVKLQIEVAKTYALVVGVGSYSSQNIESLHNIPVNQAEKLEKLLKTKYVFTEVKLLPNPTRSQLTDAWDEMNNKMQSGDNLLVFFAGHGTYNSQADLGYWWLTDTYKDKPGTWFSNSTVVDKIKEGKSKHFLLIADACFAGSIFGTKGTELTPSEEKHYNMYNQLQARKAISSGSKEPVPNDGKFFEALLQALSENKDYYLTSRELFERINVITKKFAQTLPQHGSINGTQDGGGEFIFVLK